MSEHSLQAFHDQYGVDASSVRIFTAYDPRENETHAIVALIAKALARQDLTDATSINAGISEYILINDIAEAIFEYFGWEPDEINHVTDKPVGVRHRAADTTRAEGLFGWEPDYTLEDGVAETIDWYVDTHDKEYVRENLETLLHER
jgi:UDP-glucose 4-epimerase